MCSSDLITGCNKPNPSGYESVPKIGKVIAFEDSYRGYYAARQVIQTVVLVNNEDYVYFDKINPKIYIKDFLNI